MWWRICANEWPGDTRTSDANGHGTSDRNPTSNADRRSNSRPAGFHRHADANRNSRGNAGTNARSSADRDTGAHTSAYRSTHARADGDRRAHGDSLPNAIANALGLVKL